MKITCTLLYPSINLSTHPSIIPTIHTSFWLLVHCTPLLIHQSECLSIRYSISLSNIPSILCLKTRARKSDLKTCINLDYWTMWCRQVHFYQLLLRWCIEIIHCIRTHAWVEGFLICTIILNASSYFNAILLLVHWDARSVILMLWRCTAKILPLGSSLVWVIMFKNIDFSIQGTHFIELCCQRNIPLIFLQNITGWCKFDFLFWNDVDVLSSKDKPLIFFPLISCFPLVFQRVHGGKRVWSWRYCQRWC